MVDYPDFSIYDIMRYGAIKVVTDSIVLVSGAGINPFVSVDGPGYIYALRIFVQNKVGAEDVLVYSKLDGEGVINNTFKEFEEMGLNQPGSGYAFLCQYDLVNGNFGLLLSIPSTFETYMYASGSHSIGSDVTMQITFHYAKLE